MQVGLLSDIHGNLPALEAVLEDIPPVDQVVCAGDIVGYNPWPTECIERIRDVADVTVVGNHDRTVERPHEYEANQMAEAGLRYAKEQLADSQRDWLNNLPRKVSFADGDFLLVHDHPTIQDKYVYPREFPNLRRYLDDHRGVVIGHTHIQHEAMIDDRLIVNPGSVGQPRDGDSRAAYAILDTESMSVDLRRVDYDINRVISRIKEVGLPTKTGTRLLDGS